MKKAIVLLALLAITAICIAQNKISFQVNMEGPMEKGVFVPESGDSVLLRGSFNSWEGKEYVLTATGEGNLYSGEYEIQGDSGTLIEYKFLIQKANGEALWEFRPNPFNPPHFNRTFTINGEDKVLLFLGFHINPYHLALAGEEVLFEVKEMQEDFEEMRRILENNHCCLYEYTPKKEMDALFEEQYKKIVKPLPPHEFYKILSPITARIGCMHTSVWMPGGFWNMGSENLLPTQIKLIEGYAVVIGSYAQQDSLQVPIGSILLEINGKPMAEIIEEMRQHLPSDALNPYFITASIDLRFPMIYARMYGFPEKYTVTYALPGRKTSETKVLIPAKNQDVRAVVFSNFQNPPLGLEVFAEKSAAILTIPTFGYYSENEYFLGFIDSAFQLIREKNIQNLILDLRGNTGGDPFCSAPLFSYIQPEPKPYFAEEYGKYAEFAKPMPLPENHFTGKLYTLLDGSCGSTNGHFSALLKYHKIGTFVSTPSGATYKCNAGRDLERRLPNSQIILLFGRSTFSVAVEGMDTGPIMPDIPVVETYKDFLKGKDPFLEAAWELINKK